ncbi:hypothetical protein TRIUR3_30110 [Triticum urartu]|uniref:Uncharacterized protein n=1 Tax=Triticum urartu TaxID=4572 RepID=M7ZHY7_TRIUA|nr:hypothetical protein TRIUR3_30110 [Triticum urartu]
MGETDLEDLVLSWSAQEITDGDLYGGKEQEEGVEEVKQRGGDADGVDQRDKPPPIFVQDAWSSALSEAEARDRGYSQNCIEDVPCFQIDLNDICRKSYSKLMNQIDRRMKKVSSLLLSGTPTTPPKIPGVEAFHIVEIVDAKNEQIKAIQCLFRESSLYFGAFRALGLDPDWFIFDDEPVPQWVKGTKIPYSVAHGNM